MSWFGDVISKWFGKDAGKMFLALVLKAGKIFLGSLANEVAELAEMHVKQAELTGKTGLEKYKMAYEGIKKELGDTNVPEYLINLFIEASVTALKETQKPTQP